MILNTHSWFNIPRLSPFRSLYIIDFILQLSLSSNVIVSIGISVNKRIVLQKIPTVSMASVGATNIICPITWLTKSFMVALVADCRRKEVSLGMANGGTVGDGKTGIVKCGWETNF